MLLVAPLPTHDISSGQIDCLNFNCWLLGQVFRHCTSSNSRSGNIQVTKQNISRKLFTKYTENEHVEVWQSLFALPQLDEPEVVIKRHFVTRVKECAHPIFDNWKQSLLARQRMKFIQLMRTTNPNNEDYHLEICET